MLASEFHKLRHPAIPDGRTWSKTILEPAETYLFTRCIYYASRKDNKVYQLRMGEHQAKCGALVGVFVFVRYLRSELYLCILYLYLYYANRSVQRLSRFVGVHQGLGPLAAPPVQM